MGAFELFVGLCINGYFYPCLFLRSLVGLVYQLNFAALYQFMNLTQIIQFWNSFFFCDAAARETTHNIINNNASVEK